MIVGYIYFFFLLLFASMAMRKVTTHVVSPQRLEGVVLRYPGPPYWSLSLHPPHELNEHSTSHKTEADATHGGNNQLHFQKSQ